MEMNLDLEEVLSHSGVGYRDNPPGRGSGRYPWGSGKRPHQSLKKKQAVKKAQETRARNKAAREKKQQVISEPMAREVLKYVPELTNKELDDIINRINKVNTLNELAHKDRMRALYAIDKAMDAMGSFNMWTVTMLNTHRNIDIIRKLLRGEKVDIPQGQQSLKGSGGGNKSGKKK